MTRHFAIALLMWSVQVVSAEGDQYLQEAKAYLSEGQTKAAVIQLKNLLREEPQNAEGRLLLGKTYLRMGEAAGAVKELEKARQLDMEPRRWLVPLGNAYLLRGQAKKLLEEIQPQASLSPDLRAEILALRGTAQMKLGEREAAREGFTEAVQLAPESETAHLGLARLALLEKQPQVAEREARLVLDRNPDHVDARLVVAESRRLQKDWEGATAAFSQVLERRPSEIRALSGRATVMLVQNRLDEARRDLQEARKIAGELPLVMYLQGLLEFQAGNLQAAEDALVKVASAASGHVPSRMLLGIIAYRQNELVSAEEYLSTVHRRMPNHLPTVKMLAAVKLKRKNPEAAVALLEPFRDAKTAEGEETARDPRLLALLGSAYLQNRQFDQGTALLSEAVRLAPEMASIRTQLALGQIAAGEGKEAIEQLEQVVAQDPDLVQADVMLALTLLQQKQYDKAQAQARKLAEKMPENPLPLNLIAATYLAKGELEKAETQWRELWNNHPDYLTAAMNLAKLKLRQGETEQAEDYYRRVLEKRPEYTQALLGLARIAEMRKDYKGLLKWLETAHTRSPEALEPSLMLSRYYLARGESLKALSLAREAVEKHPQDANAQFALGRAQLGAGQAANAAATFQKLVDRFSQNPRMHHFLGLALAAGDNDEAALAAWDEALELDQDYVPAAGNKIRLLLDKERYPQALAAARSLQTQFPDRSVGYFWEGEIAIKQKKFEQALSAYRKAHELNPTAVHARRLYQLYRQLDEPAKAHAILQAWLEASPRDAESWTMLAMGYQAEGNYDKAVKAYERAREVQPEHLLILNNLAWLYQKLDDPRALKLADQLVDKAQDHPEMLDTVGWIFTQNGKLQKGVTLLREASVRAPHLPAIRLHLAEALIQSGDGEEAKAILERLLKEQPQFPQRAHAEKLLSAL
ncbi:MAG: XrtA/PEP-CTERM system TPR-repeat protein PrsT [Methylohalobius sp. ZOD2]